MRMRARKDGKTYVSVNVSKEVYVEIDEDVDVDLEEFVAGLSDEDAAKLAQALSQRLGAAHTGPTSPPLMERLYLALNGARGDLRDVARDVLYEFGGRIA